MAGEFSFQELIERRLAGEAGYDLDLSRARILRHNDEGLKYWNLNPAYFEHWISFQRVAGNAYKNCDIAFQFTPVKLENGTFGAMFVCAHRILDRWLYEKEGVSRKPIKYSDEFAGRYVFEEEGSEAFDLERIDLFDEFSQKVIIHWSETSQGNLSWSQLWTTTKPIIEIRPTSFEKPFPGFTDFQTTLSEIPGLPKSWRDVLGSVGGIYLLVCPEEGVQYVGSATSEEGGFMQRWDQYAADDHGGNLYLKKRKKYYDYSVFILEIATPLMIRSDILHREYRWMKRLGTRAFGLNHDPNSK